MRAAAGGCVVRTRCRGGARAARHELRPWWDQGRGWVSDHAGGCWRDLRGRLMAVGFADRAADHRRSDGPGRIRVGSAQHLGGAAARSDPQPQKPGTRMNANHRDHNRSRAHRRSARGVWAQAPAWHARRRDSIRRSLQSRPPNVAARLDCVRLRTVSNTMLDAGGLSMRREFDAADRTGRLPASWMWPGQDAL